MSEDQVVEDVHDQLAATAELPVDPSVSTYLGEAEAVAADAVAAQRAGQRDVVDRRVRQVETLLSAVDETGHPGADEHVAAAKRAVSRYLENRDSG